MLLILFIIIFQVKKISTYYYKTFFTVTYSFKTIFLFKKNFLDAVLNIIIAIGKVQKA